MLLLIKNRLKLFIEYLKVVSSKLSIFLHSEVNLLIQHTGYGRADGYSFLIALFSILNS